MKLLIIFLYIFSITSPSTFAQYNSAPIPEKDITLLSNQLDSFPYYFSSGKAIPSDNVCHLPQHHDYSVGQNRTFFSMQALSLPTQKKKPYIRMYALYAAAIDFYSKKNYEKSSLYLGQALAIATENNFTYEELHHYRPALNNIFFLSGNYANAMKMSLEGMNKSEEINDTNRIAHFSNVIGYIHMKQKNFILAQQYFSAYLQLCKVQRDTLLEAHALYNLADLAIAQKQYDKAILFLQQSITIYNTLHSSKFSHLERNAFISNKMAEAYKLKGKFCEALSFALTATTISASQPKGINVYDKAHYYITTGSIYNLLNKPDSALLFLKEGLSISKSIIHREYIRDAREQMAIAFAQKKMFDSAYNYHLLFSSLKDSIEDESNQREILEQEAGRKIEQEQQGQKVALEKQKLVKNIIIGIALFSFITLGLLYNRYRLQQENRSQYEQRKQQNELFNVITTTQDQERKRIAEDIHDSLGSILSAAKLKLSDLKEGQTSFIGGQGQKYETAMQLLDEASSELRNISHNIMPAALSKLGLVAALRNYVNTISSKAGIQINLSAHGFDKRIDETTEMSIYRIALELINNVLKHAAATKLTIQLIHYPEYINLLVEDNGRGFEYESELQSKKGIGLSNILSRVEFLKGKINIDTIQSRGTAVIVDIPYLMA